MGSPEDERGRDDDEGPRHVVTIAQGFWMFETACREELWEAVIGQKPRNWRGPSFPGTRAPPPSGAAGETSPTPEWHGRTVPDNMIMFA
jgi:hypothetical protein